MNDLLARLSAIAVVVCAVIALLALLVTSSVGLRGTEVKAEFEDAFPLLPGMNVRVSGAVAGTVKGIELTDGGTAMVTMVLSEGTTPPSSDATAAVRQQDITGDSYVSLSLGDGTEPLGDQVIPVERTIVSPRFDDLLNSFDAPTRSGLKFILVELGTALERNGADVNEAVLNLRPAFEATGDALDELASQNQALRQLIDSSESVTGQAASRSSELGSLVDSLVATLQETEAHAPALDRALERAPETVTAARTTLEKLTRVSLAAMPLAQTLVEAAPELSRSLELLGPFLDDGAASLVDLEPTLDLTEEALIAAEPVLEVGGKRLATAPFDLAGGLGNLFKYVLGSEEVLQALFGADSYGSGPSLADDVGFGAVATEFGNQQGYEDQDPNRRFMRAVGVLSCESFGLEIAPGCLAEALTMSAGPQPSRGDGVSGGDGGGGSGQGGSGQPSQGDQPSPSDGGGGSGNDGQDPNLPLPDLPDVPDVPDLPDVPGDENLPGGGINEYLDELLDFLVGP